MGKAKALRLGIPKGVAHVATAVLPKSYKCPVCKYEFKAYDVALESKNTGISPEQIVAGHIKSCIQQRFPNQKSECLMCKEKGKTTKLTIRELDEHILQCHTDNPDSNSANTELQSSALVTESERDVKVLSKNVECGEVSVSSTRLATRIESEQSMGSPETPDLKIGEPIPDDRQ